MSRTLFLGDSHTCGYVTEPGKVGPGSYSLWNDNSYCESYAEINNKKTVVYAVPGSCNRTYPDWLRTMLDRYTDIDEVFVLLASWNRFALGFNERLSPEVLPVDFFTEKVDKENKLVDIYQDKIFSEDRFQLLNKPIYDDFKNITGISFNYQNGLMAPDLRKDSYMSVKLFFELNTHLEQRDFFKDVYTMDNMCSDYGCKLYLFNMTDRIQFPNDLNFYGKLKSTIKAPTTVESFFKKKFIDHTKYYLPDGEHYTKDFHDLIASKYIPWLKTL
jgi:hypothetical protein